MAHAKLRRAAVGLAPSRPIPAGRRPARERPPVGRQTPVHGNDEALVAAVAQPALPAEAALAIAALPHLPPVAPAWFKPEPLRTHFRFAFFTLVTLRFAGFLAGRFFAAGFFFAAFFVAE